MTSRESGSGSGPRRCAASLRGSRSRVDVRPLLLPIGDGAAHFLDRNQKSRDLDRWIAHLFRQRRRPAEMSVKGGETAPVRAAIGSMSILDISPDGSEFLLLQSDLNDETQRGTIWTMPVLGGAAKRLGNVTGRGASYSPDGKLIAFNERESVYVCDADGQNVKEVWNTHHMVPGNPAFSPDSKKIRVTVSKSSLEDDLTRIWELNADGRKPHLLPLPQNWPEGAAVFSGIWTPGGKHFVFGSFKDGSNNLYEYLEPRWFEFWSKPQAIRLTPAQPEVTVIRPAVMVTEYLSWGVWRRDRCITTTKRKSDFYPI